MACSVAYSTVLSCNILQCGLFDCVILQYLAVWLIWLCYPAISCSVAYFTVLSCNILQKTNAWWKGNVKVFPIHAINMYKWNGGTTPLILFLCGGDWLASCLERIIPGGKFCSIHWVGGWVLPTSGLVLLENIQILPLAGTKPGKIMVIGLNPNFYNCLVTSSPVCN